MKLKKFMEGKEHFFHFQRKHVFLLSIPCAVASQLNTAAAKEKIENIKFDTKSITLFSVGYRSLLDNQQEITGKIVNQNGNPLKQINIKVKGTKTITTTDATGNFRITANSGAILEISAIGYKTQQITVSGNQPIQIRLEESSESLEEAVVIGYGKQNRKLVTGAISQIGGEALQNRPITRISQALQGQVAGLNVLTGSGGGAPNATQSINVRGFTGLGTTGSPLVVIDGIQGGDINAINADDIENISILKDAASAAIYGSSAPYGVILITTKQGKKGSKPSITYTNNLNWAQPINLPKMLNSLDFATLFNEASINGGTAPLYNQETLDRIKGYLNGTIKTETIANPSPGANDYYSWNAGNANNDWFKIYFKDFSFSQQHNLSVSGGSENTTYFVGLGYNDRQGMYNFGADSYKRFNLRANLTTTVAKWVDFSLRTSLSKELTNRPDNYTEKTGGNYMHQIARKWPTVPLFNPDGNYSDGSNVLLHKDGGRYKFTTDKAILTGEFTFRLAPGWTATTNYTYDATFQDENSQVKTLYTVRPDGTTSPVGGTSPNSFYRSNYRTDHHIINAFTRYEKQLNDHYFSIMGGFVRDLNNYQNYSAGNSQLYSNDFPALSLTYGTAPSISDQIRRISSDGFFGRLNYNFKQKYVVEFNGRYDATSRFLDDVRWKFYPGVSAGWNVDQETFFEPLKKTVSAFKLKASYGSLGDQAFLDINGARVWYPFFPALTTSSPSNNAWLFGGSQQAAVYAPSLINTDLTWVTTSTLNFGTEINFLQNRLSTSFDWYIRKANDFVGPAAAYPGILGVNPPSANNAAMETRGMELSISWRDKIGELAYGIRANISDYKGKVTKYTNTTGAFDDWYVGKQMGEIWGFETYGFFQSAEEVKNAPPQTKISGQQWTPGDIRYVDRDDNKEIDFGNNTLSNPGDRFIIGNNTPRYAFGFTGDLDYKNFDFSFFLQGIAKRDAWIGSNYFWGIVGNEWQSSPFDVHLDHWTPENPNAYFPKFNLGGQGGKYMQTQTKYLQNAAYMRLKNLQFGYNLPKEWLNKIGFGKARFYVSIDNVFTITNLIKTMDPELSIDDAKIYPLQRTYSAGINLSF